VAGLRTLAGAGHPSAKAGMAIYIYTANTDMTNTALYTSDGDFLIGTLTLDSARPRHTLSDLTLSSLYRSLCSAPAGYARHSDRVRLP
jgi:homogentisate 1,2-dioxygenase